MAVDALQGGEVARDEDQRNVAVAEAFFRQVRGRHFAAVGDLVVRADDEQGARIKQAFGFKAGDEGLQGLVGGVEGSG